MDQRHLVQCNSNCIFDFFLYFSFFLLKCSEECGIGIRTRRSICDRDICSSTNKPHSVEICFGVDCNEVQKEVFINKTQYLNDLSNLTATGFNLKMFESIFNISEIQIAEMSENFDKSNQYFNQSLSKYYYYKIVEILNQLDKTNEEIIKINQNRTLSENTTEINDYLNINSTMSDIFLNSTQNLNTTDDKNETEGHLKANQEYLDPTYSYENVTKATLSANIEYKTTTLMHDTLEIDSTTIDTVMNFTDEILNRTVDANVDANVTLNEFSFNENVSNLTHAYLDILNITLPTTYLNTDTLTTELDQQFYGNTTEINNNFEKNLTFNDNFLNFTEIDFNRITESNETKKSFINIEEISNFSISNDFITNSTLPFTFEYENTQHSIDVTNNENITTLENFFLNSTAQSLNDIFDANETREEFFIKHGQSSNLSETFEIIENSTFSSNSENLDLKQSFYENATQMNQYFEINSTSIQSSVNSTYNNLNESVYTLDINDFYIENEEVFSSTRFYENILNNSLPLEIEQTTKYVIIDENQITKNDDLRINESNAELLNETKDILSNLQNSTYSNEAIVTSTLPPNIQNEYITVFNANLNTSLTSDENYLSDKYDQNEITDEPSLKNEDNSTFTYQNVTNSTLVPRIKFTGTLFTNQTLYEMPAETNDYIQTNSTAFGIFLNCSDEFNRTLPTKKIRPKTDQNVTFQNEKPTEVFQIAFNSTSPTQTESTEIIYSKTLTQNVSSTIQDISRINFTLIKIEDFFIKPSISRGLTVPNKISMNESKFFFEKFTFPNDIKKVNDNIFVSQF